MESREVKPEKGAFAWQRSDQQGQTLAGHPRAGGIAQGRIGPGCAAAFAGVGVPGFPPLSAAGWPGAVFFMAIFPHGHIPAQHWACVGGSCSRDMSLGLRAPLSARQAASPALRTVQASFIIPKGLLKKKSGGEREGGRKGQCVLSPVIEKSLSAASKSAELVCVYLHTEVSMEKLMCSTGWPMASAGQALK